MDDDPGEWGDDAAEELVEFEPARFPDEFRLPAADPQRLRDAAAAVRQEFRDSSRWKRLHCGKVSVFAERDRGTVSVVHVGKAIELDWTWEGAKAFRPRSLDEQAGSCGWDDEQADYDDEWVWAGEIVEVDEANGCLFVTLDHPESVPTVGAFFVRPFEFLSVLDSVYNGDAFDLVRERLPARLGATAGDVHPRVAVPVEVGRSDLREWWRSAWSVIWGPPGTGKTWTTGRQIAEVLGDPSERILVVSTTNKATDEVALSLGAAAETACPDELEQESLLRIGKGASYQKFVAAGLQSMLAGTEAEVLAKIDGLVQQLPLFDSMEEKALTRRQIGELKTSGSDDSKRAFVDPETRVVVATAFKATSYLRDETIRTMIEGGEAPFTTVFIDEAGLISRVAVAVLSLLAARRVVLVGDSKQLSPISRISRVLPTRQQTWLASSGLSHLEETSDVPPAVHLLSEQRRMHPAVCGLVSSYQYNGVLTTAADRVAQASTLSPFLADASRTIWYVLDEEASDLDAIRAERGPGNASWVRHVTRDVLQKLFSHGDIRVANGLFISPFKAQANAIGDLLAGWRIDSWEASTVHSQQGAEADIVVFDPVHAGSQAWGIVEWKRLINVALSRAREAVIVLASRGEMDEPYLRPLQRHLDPMILVDDGNGLGWRETGGRDANRESRVGEPRAAYQTTSAGSRMGDQFANRRGMKPLLSREQQRLTGLRLDGKPRLVRGVAGSGKSVVLCHWLAKTARRLRGTADARIWAVYANRSLRKLLCDSIESAWKTLSDGDLLDRSDFPWELVELLHVKDVLSGILPSAGMTMEPFGFDYDRAAEAFLDRADSRELLPRCTALFIDEAQDMGPSTLRLLLSIVQQSDPADTNSRPAHVFYDNAQNVYGTETPTWSDFGLDLRGRSTIMRESFRSTRPVSELAVNVLSRLSGISGSSDHKELISLGLLKPSIRNGAPWLEVDFNQVDGPKPIFHRFDRRDEEVQAIARHLRHLVETDGILPTDICVIFNGAAADILESQLAQRLLAFGVELSLQRNRSFERKPNTLLATTPHSFKGYESEVVVIPCVDHFVAAEGKLLANSLYVAMTRARSLLAIYGVNGGSQPSRKILSTIESCIRAQQVPPPAD